MRVKISYGVEVEMVPKEVRRITESGLEELHLAVQTLERVIGDISNCENDYESIIKLIQKARSSLTKVDIILLDAGSILDGLNNYKKGEQNVPEG